MTVNEALENLQRLATKGYGECQLICIDTRSGLSDELSVYGDIKMHDKSGDGVLCEMEIGTLYVPCYIG